MPTTDATAAPIIRTPTAVSGALERHNRSTNFRSLVPRSRLNGAW